MEFEEQYLSDVPLVSVQVSHLVQEEIVVTKQTAAANNKIFLFIIFGLVYPIDKSIFAPNAFDFQIITKKSLFAIL